MTWAFVRPADASVLVDRPLLDLGTGDGTTRKALAGGGEVVAVDRVWSSFPARTPGIDDQTCFVGAEARALPFAAASFEVVLAADLLHHVPDGDLLAVLAEIRRVLRPGAHLVAWWLQTTPDTSPDAPKHTRPFDEVATQMAQAGLRAQRLELITAVSGSDTAGTIAIKG